MKTKFLVITDTHFFENTQGRQGARYEQYMKTQNKCYHETKAINEAVFDFLAKTDLADDILICGDLSFNGDKQSHLSFIKLLEKVRLSGKRIYVITARHDFNENPTTYLGDETIDLEPTTREELFELYSAYGFGDAHSTHRDSLSYTADIGEDVRLFALNGDGESRDNITYTKGQIKWIKRQMKEAKEQGKTMIGMNHIPLIGGQPILGLIKSAMQKNGAQIIEMLADGGVQVVFTGHMHNQSINRKISKKGNVFFDVCTSAIVAMPAYMRLVTVHSSEEIEVNSIKCPDFIYPTNGKTSEEYLNNLFDSAIASTIEQLEYTSEKGMYGEEETEKKPNPLINFVGTNLNKITVGKLCNLLLIKYDKSLKDMLFKDLAVEVVHEIFSGNQTMKQGTPKGDVMLKIAKRFNFIKLKNTDGEKQELYYLVKHSIGNYGLDDYDAVLKLK
ncbi:MAG: metallophosphoesterase [Clostridia bacterium]